MLLYTYVLAYDPGSAPNPFQGFCTLVLCKPAIRRTAGVGDWIMGTGSARRHTRRKLVYAMRVSEVLPLEKYFHDKRFAKKKPTLRSKDWRDHLGDNIYHPDERGEWRQLAGPRDPEQAAKDLRGKNALVSDHFFYFGANAVALPPSFQRLIHSNQGHRNQFPDDLVRRFVQWLEREHVPGVHGEPTDGRSAEC